MSPDAIYNLMDLRCPRHALLPNHALHVVVMLLGLIPSLTYVKGWKPIHIAQLRHIPFKCHRHLPQILRHKGLLK